jgi:acyl-CoA synthetase (NDP forming)
LRDFKSATDKPMTIHIAQGSIAGKLMALLEKSGIPVYPSPERAVRGLRMLLQNNG